jgi:hypothetical protein
MEVLEIKYYKQKSNIHIIFLIMGAVYSLSGKIPFYCHKITTFWTMQILLSPHQ